MSPPTSRPSAERPGGWPRRHPVLLGGVLGLLVAGAIAAGIALCVMGFGLFDVAASTPHSNLMAWLVHTTMIRSVQNRAGEMRQPPGFSHDEVQQGFREYEAHCVMCHGAPGISRANWVRGLNPTPPYLMDAQRRWTPQQLTFIVANGIKMTAMPAWKLSRSPGEIRSIVAFLERLPNISVSQYARMRAAARKSPDAMP